MTLKCVLPHFWRMIYCQTASRDWIENSAKWGNWLVSYWLWSVTAQILLLNVVWVFFRICIPHLRLKASWLLWSLTFIHLFYGRYQDLSEKYQRSVKEMVNNSFCQNFQCFTWFVYYPFCSFHGCWASFMSSCYSILECYNLFHEVKLRIRSFCFIQFFIHVKINVIW